MVGGEILTFPDTPTTQGLSLWCISTYYIVAGADGGGGRRRRWPFSPRRPARARVPSRSLLPPTRNIADASHGRTPLVMRARLQAGGETIQLGNPYIPTMVSPISSTPGRRARSDPFRNLFRQPPSSWSRAQCHPRSGMICSSRGASSRLSGRRCRGRAY